jgi:hypothetical protein
MDATNWNSWHDTDQPQKRQQYAARIRCQNVVSFAIKYSHEIVLRTSCLEHSKVSSASRPTLDFHHECVVLHRATRGRVIFGKISELGGVRLCCPFTSETAPIK